MLARTPSFSPVREARVPGWARLAGPGLLISVGYMDPGNWATDIEGGSRYGYALLFVVVLSGVAALFLQTRAARLGIATGRDLAQLTRARNPGRAGDALWLIAELAIVACDIAEVLGAALALKLLFHLPLWAGVLLTGLDTLLVLGLQRQGMQRLESIVLALVVVIALAFVAELIFFPPDLAGVVRGLWPGNAPLGQAHAVLLAVGIVGATVMPHNLYLHSAIVLTRPIDADPAVSVRGATIDITRALLLATLVNAAILITAAAAFHGRGTLVTEIDQAYRLLIPLAGTSAALIFAIALLASGQSSTITGTLAGLVIWEGFRGRAMAPWKRRAITRALALVPALMGVLWLGEESVGRLLVWTQVALGLQLPFAIAPMLRATGDRRLMGALADSGVARVAGWAMFAAITASNLWLLASL
jgi:manganese transport protein